jgi:hypothetical protein
LLEHDPENLAPHLMRAGNRFPEKFMLKKGRAEQSRAPSVNASLTSARLFDHTARNCAGRSLIVTVKK